MTPRGSRTLWASEECQTENWDPGGCVRDCQASLQDQTPSSPARGSTGAGTQTNPGLTSSGVSMMKTLE